MFLDVSLQKSNKNMLLRNNFYLLLVLFTTIVFLVNTYVLSGNITLHVFAEILSSGTEVKSFFVMSGFLIFIIFENASNFIMLRLTSE